MTVLRLAAFSQNGLGGNPAGVAFYDSMPSAEEMMAIAKEVGYSETAFLVKQNDGWRVRYFAPELEVPFCGHATIALGAALGERFGEGTYKLILNNSEISVSAKKSGSGMSATLQSPETWSKDAPQEYVNRILAAFNLTKDQLDAHFPVRIAGAGATHLIIFVKDRQTLADMKYPFEEVRALMAEQNLVTISLLWQESDSVIHSRNPFAAGGVYEDPATGAAAAALAGYLRDINWQGAKTFTILQGEDMGVPSRLNVSFTSKTGERISVSGEVRHIE
ncbi:MAG: PhzF family phenazine biosynthesis protein [Anaerolineales bacterium]|uniref:PhzF family phenazine biosynthesis protein n=1 Tax=Candidatus Villigracilis vicinus TaxID=3140679 RepID=UPI0031370BBE|nr:PhzF family phenazine biosynthesis protein [Anaerolineales bacterium]MBK7450332.1 PhzF family phenazine biosynthesis protein [Anaerolineales bacterium]MBK9779947.1 PhzF family phenazine biosynthesis protein [Anaerolineales bacterium]